MVPGTERVPLERSTGRILAEDVVADRDLPPYNRATMDGIAIAYEAYQKGQRDFSIAGIARAGSPQAVLKDHKECLEIATGAVLPKGTDAVIRYEDLKKDEERFQVTAAVRTGQNIHPRGSDAGKGTALLAAGSRIGPAEISVMASIGCHRPLVRNLPGVTLISSGDELVDIDQTPEKHQIRKSNIHSLKAALEGLGIYPDTLHLPDDPEHILEALEKALAHSDVLMLSGGVSRGKFDFIPSVLARLGVEKIFHRVAQRPGKPFWFGKQSGGRCWVFSFPGNPVSTFLNYHLYFVPWLEVSSGLPDRHREAVLGEDLSNTTDLTHFRPVRLDIVGGTVTASPVPMNGSGDFISLTRADGFIRLDPESQAARGDSRPLIPFNPFF